MRPGKLLRATRARHRLTQTQLARRAGTSQAAVSKIERGQVSPSIETLAGLMAAMGERLELSASRLAGNLDDDPDQLRDARRMTPSQRLGDVLALAELIDELRESAGSGR